MTKILLTGIALATVLLALGMGAQSFAMPMPHKTQNAILSYALTKDVTQQLILVSVPTVSGGTTLKLVPKPQEGIDGIPIQTPTNSPELILASVPTPKGGTTLKWIPKPQEGIDGIPITSQNDATHAGDSSQPVTITDIPTAGDTTKLASKPQEGIDGIPIPKPADPPTILVAEPITSKGGIAVLHLVPKPASNPLDNTS